MSEDDDARQVMSLSLKNLNYKVPQMRTESSIRYQKKLRAKAHEIDVENLCETAKCNKFHPDHPESEGDEEKEFHPDGASFINIDIYLH